MTLTLMMLLAFLRKSSRGSLSRRERKELDGGFAVHRDRRPEEGATVGARRLEDQGPVHRHDRTAEDVCPRVRWTERRALGSEDRPPDAPRQEGITAADVLVAVTPENQRVPDVDADDIARGGGAVRLEGGVRVDGDVGEGVGARKQRDRTIVDDQVSV